MGVIDTPTSGSVIVEGERIDKLSDNEKADLRNRSIGFIFQDFNLVPVLSALENVMLPLQMQGVAVKEAREKGLESLERLGLDKHIHHRPAKLSGGQRQRVAIARALITDPNLVIADEPTANLDSENAMRIIDVMREINRSMGAAFVFSTHDERLLNRVDRQIHLLDGIIEEDVSLDAAAKSGGEEPSK
jgi:putative ABC transport system ATP-binding protein